MDVESGKLIERFVNRRASSRSSFSTWVAMVKAANWKSPIDVNATFPSADCVGGQWIFNVGGNNYRVVGYIRFLKQQVRIAAVFTQAEYDKEKFQ